MAVVKFRFFHKTIDEEAPFTDFSTIALAIFTQLFVLFFWLRMSRVLVQKLHFPTAPRREITLSACNELLWSACYVGLSLTFINLRIF